jgi:hypothetical protein
LRYQNAVGLFGRIDDEVRVEWLQSTRVNDFAP